MCLLIFIEGKFSWIFSAFSAVNSALMTIVFIYLLLGLANNIYFRELLKPLCRKEIIFFTYTTENISCPGNCFAFNKANAIIPLNL